jgi:16S rRNA (uracil1498-N3)-methyltransferase
MTERFYVNCPLALGPVLLQGPEAHHLATVLRLRTGAEVFLFNGDGCEYLAVVRRAVRQSVELEVTGVAKPVREVGYAIEVAVPLPKGDRAQFLIEKLTELGVTSFVPLRTQRSVVHPRETKLDKLQRHVIEASKQCGRNTLLQVQPLTDWDDYCRRPDLPAGRYLAHPGGAAFQPVAQDQALAVGPEGGFTADEVELAQVHGWQVIGLGPRILRVETVALVLAARATVLESSPQ